MLELAGLLLDFGFAVHRQTVGEKTLGEAMTANDVSRALTAAGGQFDNHAAVPNRHAGRLQRLVTRIHKTFVIVRLWRVGRSSNQSEPNHFLDRNTYRQCAMNFHVFQFGDLAVLVQRP